MKKIKFEREKYDSLLQLINNYCEIEETTYNELINVEVKKGKIKKYHKHNFLIASLIRIYDTSEYLNLINFDEERREPDNALEIVDYLNHVFILQTIIYYNSSYLGFQETLEEIDKNAFKFSNCFNIGTFTFISFIRSIVCAHPFYTDRYKDETGSNYLLAEIHWNDAAEADALKDQKDIYERYINSDFHLKCWDVNNGRETKIFLKLDEFADYLQLYIDSYITQLDKHCNSFIKSKGKI